MPLVRMFLVIFVFVASFAAAGQLLPARDTTTVNKLLEESKSLVRTDFSKAISLAIQAREMANDLEYPKGEAYALKNMGLVYYTRAQYKEALDYWINSLQIFESIQHDIGIS